MGQEGAVQLHVWRRDTRPLHSGKPCWIPRRRGAQKELEVWQAEHGDEPEEDVGSRHYADKLQASCLALG